MKKLPVIISLLLVLLTEMATAQKVGINRTNPTEALDVNGNAKADTIKAQVIRITNNAGINKVLRSDANGNGSWTTLPSTGGGGSLDSAYNFGGAGAGRSINAVNGAVLIQGTDGLQVTGVNATGADLSLSGNGTRMFFYPKKSAFRAGAVTSDNWNRDSIGEFSFAGGINTLAKGSAAAAFGQSTTASGPYSAVWGSFSAATAAYATAGGYSSIASGSSSAAIGNFTQARGFYSTTLGNNTIANSNGTLVIGTYNDTITATTSSSSFTNTTPLFIIGNGSSSTVRSNAMVVKYNGSVGIGTNNPSGRLEVNANTGAVLINGTDGLQVTGTYGSGTDLSLNGAGTKMFFYPKKAAFRAGHVTVANWNKDSIGNYSFAGGYNPIAKGNYAVALGTSANASGEYAAALGYTPFASGSSSVAIGFFARASGNSAIAIGNYAEARAPYSTAAGYASIADGSYAISMGNGSSAAGENAFAAGYGTHANGFASTSAGSNATAAGAYATAIGNNPLASGDNSFAAGAFSTASGIGAVSMGDNTIASGANSSCFGKDNYAASSNCFVLGRFNDSVAGSSAGSWIATDPLFIVGNGASAASRHNALVIFKNGNGEIDGTFIPSVSNTYSLGKNNRKWSEVWATNGTIQTSDERLKKNIRPIGYGLAAVLKMRPVMYQWKEGNPDNQVGFIAQEIVKIVPEAVVKTSDEEPLGMKYAEIIPVLTRAIQEQQQLIDELRNELEKIKSR